MKAARLRIAFAAALLWLVIPEAVWAHNCGSLSDCFNTLRAALAAIVGVGLFAVLFSFGLDLLPGIGTFKGIIEAITGRDLVAGTELEWWERILGIIPIVGALIGAGIWAAKASDAAEAARDAARAAEAAREAGRAADAAREAERAAEAAREAARAAEAAREAARTAEASGDAERAAEAAREAERAAEAAREAERAAEAAREAAQAAEAERLRKLGTDPRTGQYRESEESVAKRLEEQVGKLEREPSGDYDWIDENGRTYDAVGPAPSQHFDEASFNSSIDDHLRKDGLDIVVVDISTLTPQQQAAVRTHIAGLSPAQQERIIILD